MKQFCELGLVLALSLISVVNAQQESEGWQDEIKALKEFVAEQQIATEKRIAEKKMMAIDQLDEIQEEITDEKHDWAVKLILKEIERFEDQIEKSGVDIDSEGDAEEHAEGEDEAEYSEDEAVEIASRILDFGDSYFYRHPSETYKKEQGEFIFYETGKVNCYHRLEDDLKMHKEWKWQVKDGKIVIAADSLHGPITVTKRSPRELNLQWRGVINKKNIAKQE